MFALPIIIRHITQTMTIHFSNVLCYLNVKVKREHFLDGHVLCSGEILCRNLWWKSLYLCQGKPKIEVTIKIFVS